MMDRASLSVVDADKVLPVMVMGAATMPISTAPNFTPLCEAVVMVGDATSVPRSCPERMPAEPFVNSIRGRSIWPGSKRLPTACAALELLVTFTGVPLGPLVTSVAPVKTLLMVAPIKAGVL